MSRKRGQHQPHKQLLSAILLSHCSASGGLFTYTYPVRLQHPSPSADTESCIGQLLQANFVCDDFKQRFPHKNVSQLFTRLNSFLFIAYTPREPNTFKPWISARWNLRIILPYHFTPLIKSQKTSYRTL